MYSKKNFLNIQWIFLKSFLTKYYVCVHGVEKVNVNNNLYKLKCNSLGGDCDI